MVRYIVFIYQTKIMVNFFLIKWYKMAQKMHNKIKTSPKMFTKNAIKPLQSSLSQSPPSPMLSPTPPPSPLQTSQLTPPQSVSHGSLLLTVSLPVELAGQLRLCGPCLV